LRVIRESSNYQKGHRDESQNISDEKKYLEKKESDELEGPNKKCPQKKGR
jgi:hypothetical protein